jgi:hypothetical protein
MEQQREDERDKPGYGIDRTLIWQLLELTPAERFRLAVQAARNLAEFLEKTRHLRER